MSQRLRGWLSAATLVGVLWSADAGAGAPVASSPELDRAPTVVLRRLVIHGICRTRASTIEGLLPSPLPATLSRKQIVEFERRLSNLEIFDSVVVAVEGDTLDVTVREKWTLTPTFDFSTGRTLRDTYVALGATEYNFLGTASQLGTEVRYDQRRLNGEIWLDEHAFAPGRFALTSGLFYTSASLRFDEPEASWFRDRLGGTLGARLPYSYGSPLRVEVGGWYFYESLTDREGLVRPPSGHAFGPRFVLTWDEYKWHDLVPSGWRTSFEVSPGAFITTSGSDSSLPRHSAALRLWWAVPAGDRFVLAGRVAGDAFATGNANHSALLGSVDGVRGLADAFYRNHLQAFTNVEARYAFKVTSRLALQPAIFADAAVFEPMDAAGKAQSWQTAVSLGGGLRLVPTFLTQLLLRVDLAQLVVPDQRFFVQIGVQQYF